MRRFIVSQTWRLSIAVMLVLTLFGLTVSAQDPGPLTEGTGTFEVGPPTYQEFEWTAEPPTLTEEQRAQMDYWIDHTHLPGPVLGEPRVAGVGPEPGTESLMGEERHRSGQPLLPGDPRLFRKIKFGGSIPAPNKSNVMESSVGQSGKWGFFTGNWFAARSNSGGKTWSFVDPYADFANFCCDQISIYDEARDIFLWLRMGNPGWVGGNYENEFKLGVSLGNAANWWTYTIKPTDVNPAWTNEWWDYPHIQLGADYVYLSWNLFDPAWLWTRTVMLRIPLDGLASNAAFTADYYQTTEWFTFVPVQGAYHTMYWASNWPTTMPQNSRIGIWRWQEDETSPNSFWDKTVAAWDPTYRCDPGNPTIPCAHCPPSGTYNWAARYDYRVLTGARYSINNHGSMEPKILGRKILGWWWNVKEGQFPLPYIDGAAFYEDTMTQVGGLLGRPHIWSYEECFAYPSITPNKRQDLGAVFNYAVGPKWRPNVAYAMADDYVQAPPSWFYYPVAVSFALPSDNKWGDYNTVREFEPTQKTWIAGAHYIVTPAGGSMPVYFVFGRQRDYWSWKRWQRW